MLNQQVTVWYTLLLLLQALHIFEEIAMGAYKPVGSLKQYLGVASALVTLTYLPLFLMLLDMPIGYILACLGALLGIGNGLVHLIGYLKTRQVRASLGAGVFTAVPLGVVGGIVLYQLIRQLLFAS